MLRIIGGLALLVALAPAAVGSPVREGRTPVRDGRTVEQWYRVFVDTHSTEREKAAILLRGFGADAVPWLRRALSDPSPVVRAQAAGLLGGMQEFSKAEEDLVETLGDDPGAAVRVAAAKALGSIGADRPVTVSGLANAVAHDPSPEVRRAALGSLIGRADDLSATMLGEWLASQRAHDLHDLVRKALREEQEKAGRILGKLAEHRSWIVRATALEILSGLPEPGLYVPPSLAERLTDPSAAVRLWAVRFAGRCPDEASLSGLLARLHDTHTEVRRATVVALARMERDETGAVEKALLATARDEEPGMRKIGVRALAIGPLTPGVRAYLRSVLKDPEASVRREAAVALAAAGEDHEADEDVLAVLRGVYPVRWWPIQMPFYDSRILGRGRRALRAESGPRRQPDLGAATEEDVARAIAACGRIALPLLLGELRNADRHRRINALGILRRMGPDGVESLARGLRDGDRAVRLVAAVYLAEGASELDSAVPLLVDALAEDEDGDDIHLLSSWEKRILEAFATLGEKARPALERLAESGDEHVRKTAKKLLE